MEIIARGTFKYKDENSRDIICTINFELIMKGLACVWQETKAIDSQPNYEIDFNDRVHLVDKKYWFIDGIGRIKVKFQEDDLSNYIGDER